MPTSTPAPLRLVVVLLFSGFALAQISAPDCLVVPWGWVRPLSSQRLLTVGVLKTEISFFFFFFCLFSCPQTFNSINQNACTVAAYLMSTCNQGSEWRRFLSTGLCGASSSQMFPLFLAAFTISPLSQGYSYTGPSGVDDSNLCKCNTVAYSLISACDACQSSDWIT